MRIKGEKDGSVEGGKDLIQSLITGETKRYTCIEETRVEEELEKVQIHHNKINIPGSKNLDQLLNIIIIL